MQCTVDEIRRVTQGAVVHEGADASVTAVQIDSRHFRDGSWFIAIPGLHFDGHDFVASVLAQGARGVILARNRMTPAIAQAVAQAAARPWILQVEDTVVALGAIAAAWRQHCRATTCVGITGSNGKSTTKEMIATIAGAHVAPSSGKAAGASPSAPRCGWVVGPRTSVRGVSCSGEASSQDATGVSPWGPTIAGVGGPVLKTEGNFNNLIGLPLTLLRLETPHVVAVVEMGMSAAGEIARLTTVLDPDVGLITNISAAHLETLLSIENVAGAKGELFATMRPDRTIVVNAEDPWVCQVAEHYRGRKITFGMKNGCDVQFGRVSSTGLSTSVLSFYVAGKEYHATIPVPGTHNVMNALAATAVALACRIPMETVVERLPHFTPMRMRMERVQLENGVQVINDSYNANPESMAAAFRTVSAARRAGRFFAVLGDMLELGPQAGACHRALGAQAHASGVDRLFVIGLHARDVAEGARQAGMAADAVLATEADKTMLQDAVRSAVTRGDVVLVKGSRGMEMERVVEFLKREIGVC
ncbi:MAG: UDP-N-acetylmuramoyl-tripeptide--D-alanyl-D-alanine ligase [Deltaproteobacteria bacterium]|nr:UDP-N-acetylmuramoyl-tripeptide--D-alanyl-D-alanine ligase [Deltaproteobacteria bacterium]